jgi:hypothetical protein
MLQRYFQNSTVPTRVTIFLAIAFFFNACNNGDASNQSKGAAPASVLLLSNAPATDISSQPLCTIGFEEGIPLFPVTGQQRRLFFNVEPKSIYVIQVTTEGARSNFMLRPMDKKLAVITQKQYPSCLSDQSKFNMRPNAFTYNGSKYIRYDLEAEPQGTGFKATLSWDAEMDLGFTVRRRKE